MVYQLFVDNAMRIPVDIIDNKWYPSDIVGVWKIRVGKSKRSNQK